MVPTFDASLTLIQIPVGWLFGTNAINVSLYSDAAGVPGVPMATASAQALGLFKAICCDSRVFKLDAPVQLTAGVRYWVVASSSDSAPDFDGAWYWNIKQTTGLTAYTHDGANWTATTDVLPAVGLFGKRLN